MSRAVSVSVLFLLLCSAATGEPIHDEQRAWVNYALRCQGCHLPDAAGMDGKVPRLKEFVGYYLHTDAGRQFIIQVPGVATSSLNDTELSELMNWIVREFSAAQLPPDFVPYTADEVGRLRRTAELDPLTKRAAVLAELATSVPGLACYSDAWVRLDGCR